MLPLAFAVALLTGCGGPPGALESDVGTVSRVSDGDTVRLTDGIRIRLVQIDAPERADECYGEEAARALAAILPQGTRVQLERDPALDDRDRFGRLLRVVRADGLNVNLRLVRTGAAAPYFFRGTRGRDASALLRAAERARAERRGLWGSCPLARLRPTRAVDSGPP